MTVPEAAKFIGVHEQTIYLWCRKRKIPHFKIGGALRFRENDLSKWIEGRKIKTVKMFS